MNQSSANENVTVLSESINPLMIKQKIIQTDKIIKEYSSKCKENEVQKRKLDNMNELLGQLRKDCTKYETELGQVLQELEPLKCKWTELKDENSKQTENIKSLEDKLCVTEKLVEKYNAQLRIRKEESMEQNNKKAMLLEKENDKKQKEIERAKDRLQKEKAFKSKLTQKYKTALKDLLKFGAKLKKQNLLNESDEQALYNFSDIYMNSDFDLGSFVTKSDSKSVPFCDNSEADDLFDALLENDEKMDQSFEDDKNMGEELEKCILFNENQNNMDKEDRSDDEMDDFIDVPTV